MSHCGMACGQCVVFLPRQVLGKVSLWCYLSLNTLPWPLHLWGSFLGCSVLRYFPFCVAASDLVFIIWSIFCTFHSTWSDLFCDRGALAAQRQRGRDKGRMVLQNVLHCRCQLVAFQKWSSDRSALSFWIASLLLASFSFLNSCLLLPWALICSVFNNPQKASWGFSILFNHPLWRALFCGKRAYISDICPPFPKKNYNN